jgi:DNA-binding CsgD family transcriptional regulator
MPRRRIPNTPVPCRPDRRRPRGNAMKAQRRRGRRGQVETIAERRAMALELRKAGGSYREIARQLGVDVHTAHGDVGAELAALRETTVERAELLRDLELHRFDEMTAGLWPQIRVGSPPAVSAAIRVSERRSRLLGLDEPVVTKSELTGSLSLTAHTQLKTQAEELQRWLSFEELRDLAEKSDKLFADAQMLVKARRIPKLAAVSQSPASGVDDVVRREPSQNLTAPTGIDLGDEPGAKTDLPKAT